MIRWTTGYYLLTDTENVDTEFVHLCQCGVNLLIVVETFHRKSQPSKTDVFLFLTEKCQLQSIECPYFDDVLKNIYSITYYHGQLYIWAFPKNGQYAIGIKCLYKLDMRTMELEYMMELPLGCWRGDTAIIDDRMYVRDRKRNDNLVVINLETKVVEKNFLNEDENNKELYLLYRQNMNRIRFGSAHFDCAHVHRLPEIEIERTRNAILNGIKVDKKIYAVMRILQTGKHHLELRVLDVEPNLTTKCLSQLISPLITSQIEKNVGRERKGLSFPLRRMFDDMINWRLMEEKLRKIPVRHVYQWNDIWHEYPKTYTFANLRDLKIFYRFVKDQKLR